MYNIHSCIHVYIYICINVQKLYIHIPTRKLGQCHICSMIYTFTITNELLNTILSSKLT